MFSYHHFITALSNTFSVFFLSAHPSCRRFDNGTDLYISFLPFHFMFSSYLEYFFVLFFFNITCYFCFSFYMKMLQLVLQDRKQHGDFSFIPFYTYFLSLLLLPCYPGLTLIVCFQWQAFARHLLPWHEYKNNTFHSVDSSLTYSSEKFIFHHRSCRYRMVVV